MPYLVYNRVVILPHVRMFANEYLATTKVRKSVKFNNIGEQERSSGVLRYHELCRCPCHIRVSVGKCITDNVKHTSILYALKLRNEQ